MIDNTTTGRALARLRQSQGLTQQELAERLNISHQAVSKWETGAALPDMQTMLDLSRLYDVSIERILTGDIQVEPIKEVAAQAPIAPHEATTQATDAQPSDEADSDEAGWNAITIEGAIGEDDAAPGASADAPAVEEEQSIRETVNWEQIVGLAPFLNREKLDQLLDQCAGEANWATIMRLAPFIGQAKLGELALSNPDVNWDIIRKLAPFLTSDVLGELARRCGDQADWHNLRRLAPFLNQQTLGNLVDQITNSAKNVADTVASTISRTIDGVFGNGPQSSGKRPEGSASSPTPSAPKDSIKNRIARKALEEENWDWLRENLDGITDEKLLGEIARQMAEEMPEHLNGIFAALGEGDRAESALRMAEEQYWDALKDLMPMVPNAAMPGIAAAAAEAEEWDFLGETLTFYDSSTIDTIVLHAAESEEVEFVKAHFGLITDDAKGRCARKLAEQEAFDALGEMI